MIEPIYVITLEKIIAHLEINALIGTNFKKEFIINLCKYLYRRYKNFNIFKVDKCLSSDSMIEMELNYLYEEGKVRKDSNECYHINLSHYSNLVYMIESVIFSKFPLHYEVDNDIFMYCRREDKLW